MRKEIKEEVIRYEDVCDFCKEKASYRCMYCKKEMCRKHTSFDEIDDWGDDMGDSTNNVCTDCEEVHYEFRKKFLALSSKYVNLHEEAVEKLRAERKKELGV